MRKLPIVTARASVEIRGVYGQSVLDLYEQIRLLLVQNTGIPAVGDVFAEPQINPVRGEIAWYTRVTGLIVPVAELEPAAQQALCKTLDDLRAQIKIAGERYIAGGGQTAGTRADTFRAMLSVTDPKRCLFSVGGQPVLAEWGCSLVAGEVRSVDLWTAAAARAPAVSLSTDSDVSPLIAPPDPLAQLIQSRTPTLVEPIPLPDEMLDAPLDDSRGPEDAAAVRKPVPAEHPIPPLTVPMTPIKVSTAIRGAAVASTGISPARWRDHEGGLWGILKYLLLLLLACLLIGILVHACTVGYATVDIAAETEEQQLRREIAVLRQQAGQIAAHCVPSGVTR